MSIAQSRPIAPPQPQSNRFPWAYEGIAFRSRAHLESIIEQVANAGSKKHLDAARTLLRLAIQASRLTTDQHNDLKKRLHL